MRRTMTKSAAAAVMALAAVLVASGCGSGSATVTERQTTTVYLPVGGTAGGAQADAGAGSGGAAAAPSRSVEIQMGDFFFKPSDATALAGSVKISAPNVGTITHELVLAKTDLDPASLPTLANGEVDEEKLDSPGEIPDVVSGTTGKATIDLKPGTYAVFCNLPSHYAQGMYSSLTVSGG